MPVKTPSMVHSRKRGRITMPTKRYDSQRKADAKYREKTKLLAIRFKLESEEEVRLLEYAKSQSNTAEYIKDLIRADMEKQQ